MAVAHLQQPGPLIRLQLRIPLHYMSFFRPHCHSFDFHTTKNVAGSPREHKYGTLLHIVIDFFLLSFSRLAAADEV